MFCNPPYGRYVKDWVRKAHEEAKRIPYPIVLLIAARTDTTWFHDYILGQAEVRFLRGRLRFTDEDGTPKDPAPFPSMVVIYNGNNRIRHDSTRFDKMRQNPTGNDRAGRRERGKER